MANVSHRASDIADDTHLAGHPDLAEMRLRYERILDGRQAVAVDGLVLLTGLYLAISPWVIGFTGTAGRIAASDLVLGLAVGTIGLGLALAPVAMYRLSWAMVGIGGWTAVAPWVTSVGTAQGPLLVSNVVAGSATVLLGLCAVAILLTASRRGTRLVPGRAMHA